MKANCKKTFLLYSICIFIVLFIFLTVINPLVVYDADDWLYIGQFRKPYPMIWGYNPIKVFPEVFMPSISYFGAYVINSIIHNYCFSITLAHGIFGSIVLTLYFVEFAILFYKKTRSSLSVSIGYGLFFILLHFIAYIHSGSNNIFLFWAQDLTCFYNYTLPAALNAALVMYFMAHEGADSFFRKSNFLQKTAVIIWLYFAIFSNLYSSVILAAYIGTELLFICIAETKNKTFDIKKYLKVNLFSLLIILCWFISNAIEATGGRADEADEISLAGLPEAIKLSFVNLIAVNVFVTIMIIVVAVLWIKKCSSPKRKALKFVTYFLLTIVYLILLSAVVDPAYVYRAEAAICFLFYAFVALVFCLNELVIYKKEYIRTACILLGTVALLFINPGRIYFSYNYSNVSYKQCEALMDDIVDQFEKARDSKADQLVLTVPAYDEPYNWPIADFSANYIPVALFNHGIIDTYITVTEVEPSREKNEQFGINEFGLEENLRRAYFGFFRR